MMTTTKKTTTKKTTTTTTRTRTRVTTMKRAVLSLTVGAALALGATACGPDVPANPDWTVDVLPILQARCIRCHDTTPRVDPVLKPLVPGVARTPTGNFNDETIAMSLGTLIIQDISVKKSMPPLPAAPLDDWQIQILKNFFKAK
jgi:hypothetical protein